MTVLQVRAGHFVDQQKASHTCSSRVGLSGAAGMHRLVQPQPPHHCDNNGSSYGIIAVFSTPTCMHAVIRSPSASLLAVEAAARSAAQAPAVLHADRACGTHEGHDHGRTSSRQGHSVREDCAQGTECSSRFAATLRHLCRRQLALTWHSCTCQRHDAEGCLTLSLLPCTAQPGAHLGWRPAAGRSGRQHTRRQAGAGVHGVRSAGAQ
jgi:hypothetical protein